MKIAVISGSRADRGPLTPVVEALGAEWVCLKPIKVSTCRDAAIECGAATLAVAEQLNDRNFDLVVLLGDRFEILGAASAAYLLRLPIAHLSGGDVTEGSQDDSMRNAITKMAHLHFTTNWMSAARIIDMGEEPWRVHNVGCPGIDYLLSLELYSAKETRERLGVGDYPFYLVAYQPATLTEDPVAEADELIKALGCPCVFTTLNADAWGKQIHDKFTQFCLSGFGSMLAMDSKLYLSAMKHCAVMIGNSSSGFYEAPTLKKAFVNVGDRQKGRIPASSVISCRPVVSEIVKAIDAALDKDCSDAVNPYGNGTAAKKIKDVLANLPIDRMTLLRKHHNGTYKYRGERHGRI